MILNKQHYGGLGYQSFCIVTHSLLHNDYQETEIYSMEKYLNQDLHIIVQVTHPTCRA